MTWKEFKEKVEVQGLTDDTEIEYIDWTSNHNLDPEVFNNRNANIIFIE